MLQKQNNIYSVLAKKYNLPIPVIEVICNSPFKFAKEKIADDDNLKSIMFAYLFKFKLKKKYEQSSSIIAKNGVGNSTKTV
jgi:hypothetical protein